MIELPNTIVKAAHTNPRTIVLYSKPKQGKSTVLSGLCDSLLIDTEKGSEFIDAFKVAVDNFEDLREVARAIYAKGTTNPDGSKKPYSPPYKYLIIDTLTRIDEWSEIEGTFKYMDKPQGKSFNRVGGVKGGEKIPLNDPNFETVHEIGQGFGYRYSREVVINFFNSFNTLAPHIIYSCHVKDKFVGTTSTGGEIATKEINLTGKLKDIIASKVDTIVYGFRDQNKFVFTFAGDTGSRSPHLSGKKIVISEMFDIDEKEYNEAQKKSGEVTNRFRIGNIQYDKIKLANNTNMYQRLEFYWDKIFLK